MTYQEVLCEGPKDRNLKMDVENEVTAFTIQIFRGFKLFNSPKPSSRGDAHQSLEDEQGKGFWESSQMLNLIRGLKLFNSPKPSSRGDAHQSLEDEQGKGFWESSQMLNLILYNGTHVKEERGLC
ncbi:hypothetical protein KP509_08G066800 [Ceratopteris richardii]|uniref:Uncharacterized protein n=1 Tax=Ceratopteris richardii TaxID=49495 RepID=A0A8T2UET8_CERRI|nr:hypothetical protein KP509_08G066800 [Ceratopteris richardii]